MLTIPAYNNFSRIHRLGTRTSWISAIISFVSSAPWISRILKISERLIKKLEADTYSEREKIIYLTARIKSVAEKTDGTGLEAFIVDINSMITYFSRNGQGLEKIAKAGTKVGLNIENVVKANEDCLTALYDTLRLLKKLKSKAAQPTSAIAQAAVSRTSNTLRSLYAR